MTKSEERIINAIKDMPKDDYGEYRSIEALKRTIVKAMHYENRLFLNGKVIRSDKEREQYNNVLKIIQGMINNHIITLSKSGCMFKLNNKGENDK